MARDVIDRHGGAREQELSRRPARGINRSADLVPDRRYELPFVNQARALSIEQNARVEQSGLSRSSIRIQRNSTASCVDRSRRLADAACPLDQNSTCCGQHLGKPAVREPHAIAIVKVSHLRMLGDHKRTVKRLNRGACWGSNAGRPQDQTQRRLAPAGIAPGYTPLAMTHVFVAPHPDDVALWCGGLMASLRELGQNVTILTLFSGRVPGGLAERDWVTTPA